jgi:hypothetical protein
MKNWKSVAFFALLVVAGLIAALLLLNTDVKVDVENMSAPSEDVEAVVASPIEEANPVAVAAAADSEPMTDEDKAAAEEDRLVDAFDSETDKWMDAEDSKVPTMQDVYRFAEKFNAVPESRKEECLQRALNLIPDSSVMLLVGILMDKTQKKEFVELVYNDILNRPEDVKKPILKQIFADKTHPCWADTAWILDATGERAQDL